MEQALLHLIQNCRRRDPAAEEALFRRFAPRVLSIARRYANDEPEAMDFMQECFIRIFEKLKLYDPAKGSFEGWVYRLCVNEILQLLRKNKYVAKVEHMPDLPDEDSEVSAWDCLNEEQILDALRALPPGYREVFNLYAFERWSHREIAAALNINESASRSQLARARRRLQQHLEQTIRKYEKGLVG